MSATRREALFKLSEEYDLTVIADEPYNLLWQDDGAGRGSGAPLPLSMHLHESSKARVVSLGSFSKILAPGVRTGWIHTRSEFFKAALIDNGQMVSGGGAQPAFGSVIEEMISGGSESALAEHLDFLRSTYATRRRALCNALQNECGHFNLEFASNGRSEFFGGYFLYASLPDDSKCDAASVLLAAQTKQSEQPSVHFLPADRCRAVPPIAASRPAVNQSYQRRLRHSMRLSWSLHDERKLEEAAKLLGAAIWDASVTNFC